MPLTQLSTLAMQISYVLLEFALFQLILAQAQITKHLVVGLAQVSCELVVQFTQALCHFAICVVNLVHELSGTPLHITGLLDAFDSITTLDDLIKLEIVWIILPVVT